MQRAISALIDSALGRFSTNEHRSIVALDAASTNKPDAHCAPNMITIDRKSTIHCASPARDPESPDHFDRVLAAFKSPTVQSAAAAFKMKFDELVAVAAYRSSISEAINFAIEKELGMTPEVVAEVIACMTESLDEEIDAARADHAEFNCAEKAATARHAPLRRSASARLDALANERKALLVAIESEQRAVSLGLTGSTRYAQLRAAGLDDAAISKVEPEAMSIDAKINGHRARIREIDPQLAALRSYLASPILDADHLAGLEGFNELIAARDKAPSEVA